MMDTWIILFISIFGLISVKGDCDCDYHSGGCSISKVAPNGYACHCNYLGAWTCGGDVVQCAETNSHYCVHPDFSIGSCYAGYGDCGGYDESCDCDYHSGGCSISQVAPKGTACHCSYMGAWTCSGSITHCINPTSHFCDDPDDSISSCQQGSGDCGGYDSSASYNAEPNVVENKIEVMATAIFTKANSGVEGTVNVDENGNVFIELDVAQLDISICDIDKNEKFKYVNKDVEFNYAIYTKFDYGDLQSRNGDECTDDIIGDVYNPFDVPNCSQYKDNGDKYFECSIGDLSARFGAAIIDDNNKIIIEGNVSQDNDDKEGGFCGARLSPEMLYKRSIVFMCNDTRDTVVFCAPFDVTKRNV